MKDDPFAPDGNDKATADISRKFPLLLFCIKIRLEGPE